METVFGQDITLVLQPRTQQATCSWRKETYLNQELQQLLLPSAAKQTISKQDAPLLLSFLRYGYKYESLCTECSDFQWYEQPIKKNPKDSRFVD